MLDMSHSTYPLLDSACFEQYTNNTQDALNNTQTIHKNGALNNTQECSYMCVCTDYHEDDGQLFAGHHSGKGHTG